MVEQYVLYCTLKPWHIAAELEGCQWETDSIVTVKTDELLSWRLLRQGI